MKLSKIFSGLLLASAFALPMTAHATVIYGTAIGGINAGVDSTGAFGLAGVSIIGESAVFTFQIDTSLAPAGSTGTVSSDFFNAPAIGMISAVSMTLNGVTRTMRPFMPIFKKGPNRNRNSENISVLDYSYDQYSISTAWQSSGWDENDVWHYDSEDFSLNIRDTTATMFSDLSLPTSDLDLYPNDGQIHFTALHRDESKPYFPGRNEQEYFSLGMRIDHLILSAGDATVVPEPSILALFGLGLVGLGFARRRRQS